MIGSLFVILIVELLNSAIEWTIDLRAARATSARQARLKIWPAQRCFLSYLNCLAIWLILLWPSNAVWAPNRKPRQQLVR